MLQNTVTQFPLFSHVNFAHSENFTVIKFNLFYVITSIIPDFMRTPLETENVYYQMEIPILVIHNKPCLLSNSVILRSTRLIYLAVQKITIRQAKRAQCYRLCM